MGIIRKTLSVIGVSGLGATVVAVAGAVGLARMDEQDVINQEGLVHEIPVEHIIEESNTAMAEYSLSSDFICVSDDSYNPANIEVADPDNAQIDLTRSDVTIVDVSIDTSVLTAGFDVARLGSDNVSHDPIAVCYADVDLGDGQIAKMAAPLYPMNISR